MNEPSTAAEQYSRTERTTLRRAAERGSFDRTLVHQILDEALICHVGICTDAGPLVIPTIHCRIGDDLYIHGSPASRHLREMASGTEICVTVTLLDGLVLARSALHHSMNYRSVMVFGRAVPVEDMAERSRVLDRFVEHVVPGRSADLRPHHAIEVRGTSVLRIPLDEVSAKVRTGGPTDEPEDLSADVWAGVVPLSLMPGPALAESEVSEDGPAVPTYVRDYRRPRGSSTG